MTGNLDDGAVVAGPVNRVIWVYEAAGSINGFFPGNSGVVPYRIHDGIYQEVGFSCCVRHILYRTINIQFRIVNFTKYVVPTYR